MQYEMGEIVAWRSFGEWNLQCGANNPMREAKVCSIIIGVDLRLVVIVQYADGKRL